MGLYDSVASLFSVKAAARAEMSRVGKLVAQGVAKELVMRGYDAGRSTRSTWSWLAGSTSANAEVYAALLSLRNRSRDLVRNNPLASKAVRVLTNNAIGTGIVATARTPNKALNKKINALYAEFVRQCDYGGQMDFYGIQRLALRAAIEGGESLIRLRISDDSKLAVPLQLQLLEGDYLDHRKNETNKDRKGNAQGQIHQGVEFDAEGRRKAYWLFGEHPGEQPFVIPQSYVSKPVPASQVLHLYEILRIGQIRGVPWLTPGMMKARELDTYEEAELVRKRIEACVAAIVLGADDESQEGIAPHVVDASGNRVEQFEPGLIAIARGAKDIKFTQPANTGAFAEYKRTQVQSLAAAWDMTYELLSGDLSKVNFSSIKIGRDEFRRSVEVLQWLTVIPMMMDPIWRAFIDAAKVAGKLPAKAGYEVEYSTPKFESLDQLKDVEGDIAAVRGLMMAPQEAIRRRGYDPEQVRADMKTWHESLVADGLVSDADPALVAKAGTAPSVPAPVVVDADQ